MNTTDGNLSVHARKTRRWWLHRLHQVSFEGRLPKTEYKLTVAGRRAPRELPEPHGNAHSADAKQLAKPWWLQLFLLAYFA